MRRTVSRPADLDVVQASYDRVADRYVAMGVGQFDDHPWLRAAPAAFAETVRERGPVLDVGCGPGHVTAHLARPGIDVAEVDLSPQMVAQARRLHLGGKSWLMDRPHRTRTWTTSGWSPWGS